MLEPPGQTYKVHWPNHASLYAAAAAGAYSQKTGETSYYVIRKCVIMLSFHLMSFKVRIVT